MAVLHEHIRFYDEMFRLPSFLADPVLVFGHQEVAVRGSVVALTPQGLGRRLKSLWRHPHKLELIKRRLRQESAVRKAGILTVPQEFHASDFATILRNYGAGQVQTLDHLDARADLRHDMNYPIGHEHHERYGTLIDVGCLEHVFDTVQCLDNCMKMVRTSGHFMLHTIVNGYYDHGIHVFNPDALANAFELNGFKVVYRKFSTELGAPVDDPAGKGNVLVWMIGRKERPTGDFQCPQQEKWQAEYVDGR